MRQLPVPWKGGGIECRMASSRSSQSGPEQEKLDFFAWLRRRQALRSAYRSAARPCCSRRGGLLLATLARCANTSRVCPLEPLYASPSLRQLLPPVSPRPLHILLVPTLSHSPTHALIIPGFYFLIGFPHSCYRMFKSFLSSNRRLSQSTIDVRYKAWNTAK